MTAIGSFVVDISRCALALALATTSLAGNAEAQEGYPPSGQWDCKGSHFEPVSTVAGLPLEVRRLLVKDGPVADRGQQFQETDVIVPNLPDRRLEFAAVSDSRVAAAIERGGLPTDVWWFERGDKVWTGLAAGNAPSRWEDLAPESLDFLLYIVCRGYPQPDPPPDRAVSGVVTSKGNLVLTLRTAQATVAYELFSNPTVRGISGPGAIRYLSTKRQLSLKERLSLRSKLDTILNALSESNPNRQIVAAYVKALSSTPARQR